MGFFLRNGWVKKSTLSNNAAAVTSIMSGKLLESNSGFVGRDMTKIKLPTKPKRAFKENESVNPQFQSYLPNQDIGKFR